jgi:hypothetical protein
MLKADRDFVGILSNGTSGDVNNNNFGGPAPQGVRPGERARIVAMAVARAAFVALDHAEYTSDVTLAAAEREIELGVRKPTPADLKRAEEIMAAAKEAGKEVLTTTAEIYARESLLLAKYPDRVKLKLQAYRIGKLGLATIPCEVFTEIGLAIKAASPLKPTFTVSLANGYNGYLPTPAQHELGGYETWRARSSYLETKASDQILATLKELLADVSK